MKHRYMGFTVIEMITALSLLGLILASFTIALDGFRRFNHYQLTRQRCLAAAQAQLDSIATTGGGMDEDVFTRLWPHVTTTITPSPGTGSWADLECIEVSAIGQSFHRKVRVCLTRYIQPRQRPPEASL